MKTVLYCYSGSGNSLWVARRLAAELNDTRIVFLNGEPEFRPEDAQRVGLVFPVHMWGVPHRVREWVSRLPGNDSRKWFAVAVNAGQVSATLLQLRRELSRRGIPLSLGFSVILPSNYIPWGGPGPAAEMERRFACAVEQLARIAGHVMRGESMAVEKGPLWQRVFFTALNRLSYAMVSGMDHRFWVDESCTSCGACARVCPAGNITLGDEGPIWHHHCEQCLACLQWCPEKAIQYGKKTPGYERYHHPEIKLADMLPGNQ